MSLELSEDGLQIPDKYQNLSKIVIRTPANTIDISSGFSTGVKNDRFGLIQPRDFQEKDDELQNPELEPNEVTFKPYNEDPETFVVDVQTEQD